LIRVPCHLRSRLRRELGHAVAAMRSAGGAR
jgi:hypothetical protein